MTNIILFPIILAWTNPSIPFNVGGWGSPTVPYQDIWEVPRNQSIVPWVCVTGCHYVDWGNHWVTCVYPGRLWFVGLLPIRPPYHMSRKIFQWNILVRWHRMNGKTTLWNPGCDHAGIATQDQWIQILLLMHHYW